MVLIRTKTAQYDLIRLYYDCFIRGQILSMFKNCQELLGSTTNDYGHNPKTTEKNELPRTMPDRFRTYT